VFNLAAVPRTVILEASISPGSPTPSRLRIMSVIGRFRRLLAMAATPWLLTDLEVSASEHVISQTVIVPPGRHLVTFASDARNLDGPGDPGRVFRVRNFRLRNPNESP
jgi:hypothetical protein